MSDQFDNDGLWTTDSNMRWTYRQRCVSFIDVLGFARYVDGIRQDPHRYEVILKVLTRVTKQRPPYAMHSPFNDLIETRGVTAFSDSLVVSNEAHEFGVLALVLESSHFALTLLTIGLPCRGAISIGRLHHEDEVVFGSGLNRAYFLERDGALHPRIILDTPVAKMAERLGRQPFFAELIDSSVSWGDDGIRAIHFLSPAIITYCNGREPSDSVFVEKVYSRIGQNLVEMARNACDVAPRRKVEWLVEYFNRTIRNEKRRGIQADLIKI